MDYSKHVPAAERALNILELLSAEPDGLTASDLLERLDLSRSALFALLNTLKARDYVVQHENRGRYRLGPALWTLAPGRQDDLDAELAEIVTQELRQAAARLSFRLGAVAQRPDGRSLGEPLGPNRPLSLPEIEEFLQGPWSARLACVRADGTPHVLPLWYEWDGHFVWLAASPGAQWKQVVRESERVSLAIDEPWPPLRRAFILGAAELAPTADVPGGLQGLRQRLAVRYLGQGAGERAELQQTEGWDAVRVRPERISGQQGLGRA